MSDDSIPGQLDAIHRRLEAGDKKMHALEEGQSDLKRGQDDLASAMKANTEITADIRDIVTAGRVGTKVVKWLGAMALAISAIWGVVYAALHGGKLPHQ